jgi:DNA-binding transcriptional regulator YhcF (GntR family)
MNFFINKKSPIAPNVQISEQVRVALLLGNLRPGEILPSIRDLEVELSVSRDYVRKAYKELAKMGILTLIPGKGVMVDKNLTCKSDTGFLKNCEELVELVRKQCQSKNLNFPSLVRFLQHKAVKAEGSQPWLIYADMTTDLAKDRADQLGGMLHVNVLGCSFDELEKIIKGKIRRGVRIVCNYYRISEVKSIVRGKRLRIVALRMRYGKSFNQRLRKLGTGSKVMFIADQIDQTAIKLLLEDYHRVFAEQQLQFVAHIFNDDNDDIEDLIKSDGYALRIVSNRIWNHIPQKIQKMPNVTRPIIEFDLSSVEESKTSMGITG